MLRRFKALYGKPKTLTDRYDECREVDIARVLHKPEAELRWDDFNMLFRVGVASASYEEGVYFLPAAFAFLRRHPNPDTVDCIADVIWFVSEHAARLEQDGLLEACREQVLALLHERTAQFVVVSLLAITPCAASLDSRRANSPKGFLRISWVFPRDFRELV